MNNYHERTRAFYDSESSVYTKKRYQGKPDTYVQFYFQNRLRIVIELIKQYARNRKGLKILDVGCADGVMTWRIRDLFPDTFIRLTGTDISPAMIDVAGRRSDPRVDFYVKDRVPAEKYDIVLMLGYVTPAIFNEEVQFLRNYISTNGICIMNIAASDSLHARLKVKKEIIRESYLPADQYFALVKSHFDIITVRPNGLFIPKLWAVPILGRLLQPVMELVFSKIWRKCYHENIVVLRLKA